MRDQKILLEDILASIEKIENELKGISESEFKENTTHQDVVIRRLAIIGEASKHLTPAAKSKHKEINWKNIAGMRDFLVHEYFNIDVDIVWVAAEVDLPVLKRTIIRMLSELK